MSRDGLRALIADVARRRPVRWYLCVAAILTVFGGAMQWLMVPPTGLVRTVYSNSGFSGEPLFQDLTTEISLAFLDKDPTLPRRFFSVEWSGFWFWPRARTVELYAAADDSVDILVDGQRVLRRNPSVGMATAGESITLGAGPHEIVVRYVQDRGGVNLNVQHAFDGNPRSPLVGTQLFSERPDLQDFALATGTYWLIRLVAILWLVPIAGLLVVIPNIGTAGSGGKGSLIGSALETSNVDIAEEFTKMILAQRGFQASSRTITVSDELLLETLNLKR